MTPPFTDQEKHVLGLLNRASEWVIRNGRFVLSQRGYDFLFDKLIDDFPVQLWVEPFVDEGDHIADFRLKLGGYYYDLETIDERSISGTVYEYWVIHIRSADWVTPLRLCFFYIVAYPSGSSAGRNARREILAREGSYIPRYVTSSGEVFAPRVTDPVVLYRLRAWEFPLSFPGQDFASVKVEPLGNGRYEMVTEK
ncbi:MAG: hypothetical protein ACE368_01880 [Paracoccaceae bacterium]